jgi:hypothetical protein
LQTVRSLTPAAEAACASDHPCSVTRLTMVSLPFGPKGGICVKIHPVSSLLLGASNPSLQGGPDEQGG